MKKQAAVPYCVSKELSLEILFLHTRRETIYSFSTSEERPLFRVRIAICLQASSDLLSCLNYFFPHDPCLYPQLFLLACEQRIRIEEPLQPLGSSQNPVCSVKQWRGSAQAAAHASILLSPVVVTLRVSCAVFLGLNRRRGKLNTSVTHSTREIVGDTALKFP